MNARINYDAVSFAIRISMLAITTIIKGMIMKKIYATSLIAAILAGCASQPDKLSATYADPSLYRGYDCDQIRGQLIGHNRRLATLKGDLEDEADADAWQMGLGLIILWPTLFWLEGGDSAEAAEYQQLKGEVDALQQVFIEKKCDGSASASKVAQEQPVTAKPKDAYSENKLEDAKSKCTELGFKAGTEKFGECVLKLAN